MKSYRWNKNFFFYVLCFFIIILLSFFYWMFKKNIYSTRQFRGRNIQFVDFHQGMCTVPEYNKKLCDTNHLWRALKNRYDTSLFHNKLTISDIPKIPKIIHRIWLGSPQPPAEKEFEKSWLKHHPNWLYILWTDKEVAALGLQNQQLYDRTTNWGEKSDIARYEILYRFGGLYVDTDFECCKPFDILHHCCDFYTGLGYFRGNLGLFNGLIGSRACHPILKACIENIKRYKYQGDTFDEILHRTGPYHFTRCFIENINCPGITLALPVTYFYPWPNNFRDQNKPEQIRAWIKPETLAVHHWHVSWNGGKTS